MKDEIKIVRMYKKGISMVEIAETFKTYPNKIKRLLIKQGVQLRGRSEVQSLALRSGRRPHPTKGKPRPIAVREKISDRMESMWDNMDEEEKTRRKEIAKEIWHSKSPEEIKKFRANIVKASREGSKLEKEILTSLKSMGFEVIFHAKNIMDNQNLHVDLFLPKEAVVIEIDGPSHYEPIWGDEALERQRTADLAKNGLLITKGIRVLRIKADKNTNKYRKYAITKVLEFLNSDKQIEHIGDYNG